MAETIKVDALGDGCPIPVVKTKKALQELTGEGIIQTHVDNEIAVQNLSKMAKQKGLVCSSEKIDDRHFVVTMEVGAAALEEKTAKETVGAEQWSCIPDSKGDFVVSIGSAGMGEGNDELGAVLMKGFIYALSQLENLPSAIIFYNGGVTLTTEGSDSIEDLKSMEAQGVVIKSCGTCLNYYGCTDKLLVGEVSNMYDIVETLSQAGKVIRP